MVGSEIYRNDEEKKKAVKLAIIDTKQQIKISEEYLVRLRKKLDDLLTGKITNPRD